MTEYNKFTALVTRVGDALQEPFWPEGLGINRGPLRTPFAL